MSKPINIDARLEQGCKPWGNGSCDGGSGCECPCHEAWDVPNGDYLAWHIAHYHAADDFEFAEGEYA